ncbi:peptidase [Haloparvum sp. PAK95]|uniref:pyroglutamyl-peptidase I family protein n=1 Tax=Haloparvum sp. PAK95 TaxID=3418962 RepID=UPI003D2F4680
MTVLCTGYEPFGDHDENPSAMVAERLDGRTVAGHDVVGRVLPVEFDALREELASLVDEHDPDAVVGMGLAGGRASVAVERVGINVADAVTVPDNAEADPENERVDAAGPDAYLATLPVVEAVQTLLDAGIPARVSNTAGTHCCNDHLYTTHRLLAERGDLVRDADSDDAADGVPAGFVHLPLTPAMAAGDAVEDNAHRGGGVSPSMAVALQVDAVEQVVETTLEHEE